jgi:hypothetical protein
LPPFFVRASAAARLLLTIRIRRVFFLLILKRSAFMPDKPSDLVQGTLDMLILKTLHLEPMHGYGIAARIEQMSKGPDMVAYFPRIVALAAFDSLAGDVVYSHHA